MKRVILVMGLSIFGFSGCVTARTYDTLYKEFKDASKKLEARDRQVLSLEKALADEQAKLEAIKHYKNSAAELRVALAELQRRKVAADKRVAEFRRLLARFQKLIDAGKLKIHIIEGRMVLVLPTDILFPSGSAKLSKGGKTAIREVAGVLASMPDRKFQVEGHTDNVPIRTRRFRSNWELASSRALGVVKEMMASGMSGQLLSAASYGDYQPIATNDTAQGRKANRRIDIVLVPDLSALPGFAELEKATKTR
jgi:chemotaxis protein MotB